MSSAAVLLDCKIRNAQKIPTEEGLQSKGSSHMDTHISDGEEMGTQGCTSGETPGTRGQEGTSSENQTQCNASLTRQVWHVYSRSPCHKEG